MKTILLTLIFCFIAEGVGWKGNSIEADGISYTGASQDIQADDTVVPVGLNAIIKLSSDSNISADRTILMQRPTQNNVYVLLVYEDESTHRIQLQDDSAVDGSAGTVQLSGPWNPNSGDTLLLFYSDPNYYAAGGQSN